MIRNDLRNASAREPLQPGGFSIRGSDMWIVERTHADRLARHFERCPSEVIGGREAVHFFAQRWVVAQVVARSDESRDYPKIIN